MKHLLGIALTFLILVCPSTIQADVISVEAGTGTLSSAVNSAQSGDVIELTSSGGIYHETTYFTISVPLTIRVAAGLGQKPILSCDYGSRNIRVYNDLNLEGIVFDGALGANETVRALDPYGSDATLGYDVFVENCDFLNLGISAFYAREGTQADTVSFNNCTFDNIGEVCLNFIPNTIAPASVLHLIVSNSTFSNIAEEAIRIDGTGDGNASLTMDQVTLFGIGANAIVPSDINNANITNTIVANPISQGTSAFYMSTGSFVSHCLYYNFSDAHMGGTYGDTSNVVFANPRFVAPTEGDFSLYSVSSAIGAGTTGQNLGDPRWEVVQGGDDILALVKGPYSMAPTTTSFNVLWQTPVDAPVETIVEYGLDENYGSTVTGEDAWLIEGEGYIHEATVEGLEPFTVYHFRVSDGTGVSSDLTTKTAPLPGTDFKLMIGGDSRSNEELWGAITTTIKNTENIDMAVYLGDYVGDGHNRDEWNPEFFDPAQDLHSTRPFIGCIGNHETAFGPTAYYDYVNMPHHVENGETPESYFNMVYGDVNFLVINSNSNPSGQSSNEEFAAGTLQHQWIQDVLAANTSPWVFVIQHTPILSTSNHGQWTGSEKAHLMPLFEDYVADGGHVIVFNGDDHNFEHLYKDGVHHVRPAGGGASLYDTGYNMADLPWSLFFEMTHNYSTIEVSDGGASVDITAHYPDGEVFYTTTLTTSDTPPPNIYIIEPNGVNDSAEDQYLITWSDSDPDNDASINLYYNTTNELTGGTLIVSGISEDAPENSYLWDLAGISPGDYYIYATIDDGVNPVFARSSGGVVTVLQDVTAPPPVSSLNAELQTENSISLSWINPTYTIDLEETVADFDEGFDGFIGEGDHTQDTGTLELVEGVEGQALRINYSVGVAWGQYGGFKYFPTTQDWRQTPILHFWYRGDGSPRRIRLIVSQDNDGDGSRDDQWYSELFNLATTTWQEASINLTALGDLGWDIDIDQTFDLENIFSIEFIIPSGTICNGYLEIDDVNLTGVLPAAPDFVGTKIVRNMDHSPSTHTDGVELYSGDGQAFIDTGLTMGQTYHYGAFAYDEVPNYSDVGPTSILVQTLAIGAESENQLPVEYALEPAFPNPFNPATNLRYALPENSHVTLTIYDIRGMVINNLVVEEQAAGWHEIQWNGETNKQMKVHSGVYFARIQAGKFSHVTKMILLK